MNDISQVVKNKIMSALKEYSMLDNTSKVVVGFSGGADSLCLLHFLNQYKDELSINVEAAHINHGIRGDEAQRDAVFAEKFCKSNNIAFHLLEVDCVAEAEKSNESLEECGRRIRYGFFESLCDDKTKIATAHNCNDNAETVVFNIVRGASFNGACGIPPKRDNIIRPLIYCTRDEIEGYCQLNNLQYVTDSTNLSCDYTRNKIRHLIIPVMNQINSAALSNITSFSSSAKDITSFINNEANNALMCAKKDENIYDVTSLLKYDKVVIKQAIMLAFRKFCNKSLDSTKIDKIYQLLLQPGRLQLFGDIYVEVVKKQIRFFKLNQSVDFPDVIIESLPFYFNNDFCCINISEYKNSEKINKMLLDNLIDCDKIVGNICLRTRREGDKFKHPRRKVTKTLKKLFNELNIPVEMRDSLPVLCDDQGVIWVYSVGVDYRCCVDDKSSNIIFVRGEDNNERLYNK